MHSRDNATRRNLEQNQLIQILSPPDFYSGDFSNCSSIRDTGDAARETYRLSTFNSLSRDVPVDPLLVAAHGFYYTGSRNIVKCFSCGKTGQLSVMSDEFWLRQTHDRNCSFANGNDSRNESIQTHSPYENGNSFALTNGRSSPSGIEEDLYSPAVRGHASLHCDRVQYETGTLPSLSIHSMNNATTNIQTRLPSTNDSQIRIERNLTNFDDRFDALISGQQTISQPQAPRINLETIFPCNQPLNPHMRSFEERLHSFFENIEIWNNHSQMLAPPDDLAEAGLYCLGERDRTKCWYCNGGLQNWKRGDDPWEEHAKWFPMCEFVLQKKGPDYVHRIVARFPNLRRPQMLHQPTVLSQESQNSIVPAHSSSMRMLSNGGNRITSGLDSIRSNNQGPEIVDLVAERRERNRKIDDALRSSGIVTQARIMGFQENAIKTAVKKQFELHNRNFSDINEFVEAITDASNHATHQETSRVEESNFTSHSNRESVSPTQLTTQSAFEEIQHINSSRLCRRCRNNPACVVFIPCGHMVCCHECQNDWERCPICQSYVREKIRSYLS